MAANSQSAPSVQLPYLMVTVLGDTKTTCKLIKKALFFYFKLFKICPKNTEEKLMKRRSRMSKKRSRKSFSKGASRTHKFNLNTNPMRGGIRL